MLVGLRMHLRVAVFLAAAAISAQAQDGKELETLSPKADAVARLGEEFKNTKFSIRPLRGLKAARSTRPESEDGALFAYWWTPDGKLPGFPNLSVGLTPFAQPSSDNLDSTLEAMGIDTQHIQAARFRGFEVRFGHHKLQIRGQEIVTHVLVGIDTRGSFAVTAMLLADEATPERTAEVKASLLTFKRTEKSLLNAESGADWSGVPTLTLEPSASGEEGQRFTDSVHQLSWHSDSKPKVIQRKERSVEYRFFKDQVDITATILKSKPMIESARSGFLDTIESLRAHAWKKLNIGFTVKPIAHLRYLDMIGRMMIVTIDQEDLLFADLRGESLALTFIAKGPRDQLEPAIKTVLRSVTTGESVDDVSPVPAPSEAKTHWHAVPDAPLPVSNPTGAK